MYDILDDDNNTSEVDGSPDSSDGLIIGYFGHVEDDAPYTPPDVASTYFPSKFVPSPPTATPESLFVSGVTLNHHRFVRRSNNTEILIYTDGACLNNGQANPTGGWAFVYRPASSLAPRSYGTLSRRLENTGPTGAPAAQTSNRAELRAVIGALQFRQWAGEAERLVIATDSSYAVNGATEWARGWETNGWRTAKGQPVANRDLWELLLKNIRELWSSGVDILFWRIDRSLNVEADRAAKDAASQTDVPVFMKYMGIMMTVSEMGVVERAWGDEEPWF